MEQSIGYSAEEPEPDDVPRWQRQEEYMLAKRQSSQEFLQYKSYHLHLKRKSMILAQSRAMAVKAIRFSKDDHVLGRTAHYNPYLVDATRTLREGPPEFKNFPTTYWERLSFYRTYLTSPNKSQILCFYAHDLNKQIWRLLLNALFLTIPYTYVHVFLASYVPETPLYLAKMVPFMEGISISIIIAAVFEVFTYVSNGVHILDFLFNAIFAKNPWNECPEKGFYEYDNMDIYCYHLDNIAERIKNKTILFDKAYYLIVEDDIKFQFGQILYNGTRKYVMSNWLVLFYGVLIWTIVVFCYEKVYSRWIWKVLHTAHSGAIAYFVVSYLYHLVHNNISDQIPEINFTLDTTTEYFPKMNFNMFSISLTAPPVIHILKSRSSDEIQPSRDSAVIVISTIMFSFLRVLTTNETKRYMETVAQLPIYMPSKSHMSTWYIYFPLYFSLFYFGDVFSLLFFLQLFITEIISCIIHLEMTLDIIMSKWKMLPRRIIGLVLITVAVATDTMQRYVSWNIRLVMFFNKLSVMVVEVILIFWMYPVFRLIDDMSFHHGYPVHPGRLFCLITAPLVVLYFAYKSLYTSLVHLLPTYWGKRIVAAMVVAFPSTGIPIVAGMCYAYYKYVLKARRSWRRMFAPAEDWGPKDYVVRQLRKDYDSRTYTNSEVSRNLSRHIFTKTERKAYELDISYDPNRRSTQIVFELKGPGIL